MADLNDKDIAQSVKITGANPSTGIETNYLDVDSSGRQTAKIQDSSGNNIVIGQTSMANSVPVTIASDQSTIDVVNVGSTLDLINNALYSTAETINATSNGVNNPLVLIRNPIGSGKIIYIKQIGFGVALSNKITIGRLFVTPTVTTNGTALPTVPRNVGNGATAAVALITQLPTVSSPGTKADNIVIGPGQNTDLMINDFSLGVQPGNAILITASPDANNVPVSINILWSES